MGRRPITNMRNFVIFFQESVNKKFEIYSKVLPKAEKVLSENLFCKKACLNSLCVLFIHKLSKHDHGAAEVQTSYFMLERQINLPANKL